MVNHDIFNNYPSRLNGPALAHEGERDNCFSKIHSKEVNTIDLSNNEIKK